MAMADLNDVGSEAEAKITAFFDKSKYARNVAWAAVVVQLLLCIMLATANVNSMLAAIACFGTACILVWLLNKTRPPVVAATGA